MSIIIFVKIVKYILYIAELVRRCIQFLWESESPYITPKTKVLLHKCNKLCQAGKAEEADNLALRINIHIARARIRALSSANNRDKSQIWKLLKSSGNWRSKNASKIDLDPHIIYYIC